MQIGVQEGSELLTEMMKEDPDYRNFISIGLQLEETPELAQRIHSFRKRNFDLQNSAEDPEAELWDMNQEYQELIKNPLVSAYFEAEAGVCRMMREVLDYICSQVCIPEL
ncbi:MAG: YlbF family regulator [Lachnospiraceae bacterium]|nr:YlbF family regulator [Lachnospiraceae bacterium]